MTDYSGIARSALNKALGRQADQVEVFICRNRTLKIEVIDQKIETVDEIDEAGLALRLIKDQRLGFSYSSDLNDSSIDDLIDQALAGLPFCAPDPWLSLPSPQTSEGTFSLLDQTIEQTPIQKKIAAALLMETAAHRDPRVKKTEKVSYTDSEQTVWIVNSNGIDINYRSNHCGGFADVIAVEKDEMESGYGMDFVTSWAKLDPEKIGSEAAERATQLLGARAIASQNLSLVVSPSVGAQLLEILAQALSSEAVQKGRSLFANLIGQPIAASKISVIDNGRLPAGIASAFYDAEGVPTRTTGLIENGILKSFLFNSYTAAKAKTLSTGNAVRASYRVPPAVGHTNLYLSAGSTAPDKIISAVDKGLYLTRIMGAHTANPVSGDFSFGAAGIMIEKGEKSYPIRGITIAGNLLDLLKKIEMIGSDLRFFAEIGSPTLLLSELSVSGT